MKIHEYQAKELFRRYNILVPNGQIANTSQEAEKIAQLITSIPCIIKAQVHSGARGKAGGIKIANSIEEVRTFSAQILGMDLSSVQTGGQITKS